MPLNPQDIQYREFRRAWRGFDENEVADYLAQVGRKLAELAKDNADLRDKVEEYAGRLEQYTRTEDVLHNALLVAQETAAEVKANAHREAALIKQQAEQEAEAVRHAARQAADKTEAAYAAMVERWRMLRTQVRGMLLAHLDLLEREGRLLVEQTDVNHQDEAAAAEIAAGAAAAEAAATAAALAETAATEADG